MVEGESEAGRLYSDKGANIETSEHAARGSFACTSQGVIVARGRTEMLADLQGFDTVFCHDDDEAEVLRILIESREQPGKSLKARLQGRFSIAS